MQNPISMDSYAFTELDGPLDIALANEGSFYYGLVTSSNGGDLVRLSLGEVSAEEDVSVTAIPSSPASQSITIVENGTSYMGFSVDGSATLSSLSFDAGCTSNVYTSSEFEPTDVYYSGSGGFVIALTATDDVGVRRTSLDTVTVISDTAPDASFTIDENRCISNANTFTPAITGLTSYSWDFNNDGIEDSNSESPQVLFDTLGGTGTYTVRLDVIDGSCDNFHEEEITIYPEPPVPSFTVTTSGAFCTNNEFTLTNTTDETGYDDVLTYQWVIDGDVVNQKDTVYTFSTSGIKTITLQSFLPGCSSTVTSEDITIDEGPEVSFNFTNNCFGEAISFTSEVVGENITRYVWDFGDGEGTSTAQDTAYQYSTAGVYTVSLSVTNASGCTTTFTRELEVNNQPLADFTFGEAIENLPVDFNGTDLTLTYDSIVSWEWDFDGLGSATERSTSFTFNTGIYDITLSAETVQGCLEVITKSLEVVNASYPTPQFSVQSSLCSEERLLLSNESVNAVSYEWDFCFGDLASTPTVSTLMSLSGVNNPQRIKIVEDSGKWYGFVTSRNQNSLVRISFGEALDNPSLVVTSIPISGLSNGDGFVLEEESGEWVGFLLSSGNNKLFRLTFGSDLANSPSIEDLGGIGSISSPRGLDYVAAEGVHYLIASNIATDTYTILNFGSSVTTDSANITSFTSDALAGADLLADLEVVYEGGSFYGYGISFGNNTVHRLSFGSSLMQNPISMDSYAFTELDGPLDIALANEGSFYYGLVTSSNGGDLVRLSLGEVSAEEDVSVIAIPSSPASQSITIVENGTSYMGFSVDGSATLSSLSFDAGCTSNVYTSSEFEPTDVYYSGSGGFVIALTATDDVGVRRTSLDTITVISDTAPDASFTIDENRCISNANTFTPAITGLTSYSWDFNNDGIEDSNSESPQVLFDTLGGTGTYTVRLDVIDGSCDNFHEEEITIYPEPPVPSFTVTASTFCEGSTINISNTTDDSAYGEAISYHWTVTGIGDTTTSADLNLVFDQSGEKVITVYSSIPGCSSDTFSDTITIQDQPLVAFDASATCDGELTTFTNTSEGVTFSWNFGDGFTSTAKSPDHLYDAAGRYDVVLNIVDANGCTNQLVKEVVVDALPQAEFEYSIVCEENTTTLRDVSLVNGADIVAWEWYVEDELVTTGESSPEITFAESGKQIVRMEVYASNGCDASYSEVVEVLAKPVINFGITPDCIGQPTTFEDFTAPEEILNRVWAVNGEELGDTGDEVSMVFDQPGTYEVSLMVENENFCSDQLTKTFEILQAPSLGFSVEGNCANENIVVSDTSLVYNDSIVSRSWYLDGALAGNGREALLPISGNGTANVELRVATESGCAYSSEQLYDIYEVPVPAFTPSNDFGVPPFSLDFTNQSEGASAFRWLVDGEEVSTEHSPTLFFNEPGTREVVLEAITDRGCVATTSTTVLSALPDVDLSIEKMQLVEDKFGQQILLEIQNESNLPIEQIRAEVELQNEYVIGEIISTRINPGSSAVVTMQVTLPLVTEVQYVCVRIASVYNSTDRSPDNNENCIAVQPEATLEPAFPNPTSNRSTVRAILSKPGNVTMTILDLAGQILETKKITELPAGLNSFTIDLSTLDAGTYFVQMEHPDGIFQFRVTKQ
ncbi:PKD domain-containing protein [Marinoscillum furvescens]|uniref:PKD domain-containing protein n=1 Tax=Marinoscillum furvescens TaxID=1026 RepID=UPI000E23F9D2|nr:PKD domain-containing protein [Marinoscillum furvescens]